MRLGIFARTYTRPTLEAVLDAVLADGLDAVQFNPLLIDGPGLQVPHPRLHEREFVLEPLAELGWTPADRGYTGS